MQFFLEMPQEHRLFPPKHRQLRALVRCLVNIALAMLWAFSVFGSIFCAFNMVFN